MIQGARVKQALLLTEEEILSQAVDKPLRDGLQSSPWNNSDNCLAPWLSRRRAAESRQRCSIASTKP